MVSTAAAAGPVFLHSWWRTSSTYVWSKFRLLDSLWCYSEPLHEMAGGLTLPIVRGRVDAQAVANLHHPPMERPYFAEYEPLLLQGGTGFGKALSYDRYFLYPHEADVELERYLVRLIGVAHGQGRRPMLAFARSSLRAAWMKRRFGGLHLALLRNPRDQWGSMLEQHRQGGTYFLAGVLAVAGKLAARFRHAFAHVPYRLMNYQGSSYNPAELGAYLKQARDIDLDHAYALFALVWLVSALQIVSVADVVLDSDLLSQSADARRKAEAELSSRGLLVDFADWTTPRHPDPEQAPERLAAIEAAAARALGAHAKPLVVANDQRVEERCAKLDPASANLLRLALDELRRVGFFSRTPRDAIS